MGCGAFIEVLSIVAWEFGYQAETVLFPEGIDTIENIGKSPVARIILKLLPE
jgi:hypothetical protein